MVFAFLVVYLVILLGVGIYTERRVKSADGFLLANRSFPTPIILLTFVATYIGGAATLGKASLAYSVGFSAIILSVAGALSLFGLAFLAARIHKLGVKYKFSTIPDLIKYRYGKYAAMLTAIIILWTLTAVVGSQLTAMASIFKYLGINISISYTTLVIISALVVVIYTTLSGFYGVVYTDVIQAVILLATIGLLLPILSIVKVGGFSGMSAALPASYFSLKPDMTVIGYSFVYLLTFMAGPVYWQRVFASKNYKVARRGFVGGAVVIILYSVVITLLGMSAKVLLPNLLKGGVSSDAVLPLMANQLFPTWVAGFTMAAILAVLMSTISSYLINASQTVGYDFLRLLKPDASDRQVLVISRWSTVIIGIGAIFFALFAKSVLTALIFAFKFYVSALSVPILAALLWRKTTKAGYVASMLTGTAVALIWQFGLRSPYKLDSAIPGGLIGAAVLIVVSLATYNAKNEAPFPTANEFTPTETIAQ